MAQGLERRGAGTVELLLGDGSGTAFTRREVAAGPEPVWITSDDLDRDGDLDLVVMQYDGGQLSVLAGRGDGTFAARRDYALDKTAAGSSIHGLAKAALGDIDGDGYPDIAAANPAGKNTALLVSDPACAAP